MNLSQRTPNTRSTANQQAFMPCLFSKVFSARQYTGMESLSTNHGNFSNIWILAWQRQLGDWLSLTSWYPRRGDGF
eukprot:1862854-Amphidinium_carterae.1